MPTPLFDGPEFLVNSTTASAQYQPGITALPDGRFVVVWTDLSQTGGDTSISAVRGQIFAANGSKAGAEFLVNTTTVAYQWEPSITALPDGRFVVVWRDGSGTGGDTLGVRGQIFAADGSKAGAEFLVNSTTFDFQFQPSITTLPDGRFVVVWRDDSETGGDTSLSAVRGQIFAADGSKAGAEFLVNTTTANSQDAPSITALPDGRFVVVWTDDSQTGGDTSNFAVRGQVFAADGSKAGAEFLVNTTTANSQFFSSITALPDGRFVVVWQDDSGIGGDTSAAAVRGQVFAADGGKAGAEFLVNTTTTGYQWEPSITALPDGRFVVVWRDDSESGGDTALAAVRGQVFAADGSKAGAEFLVNTTTGDIQNEPSITTLLDGRLAVVWADFSQTGGDTTDFAVRGQILDPRQGVIHLVNGVDTQPRQLGHYDLIDVLPGASLVAQNAPAVRTETDRSTNSTVLVDGTVRALSSGPATDAIHLVGTATGTPDGMGGHSVSIGGAGLLRSSHGNAITLAGDASRVENAGEILAARWGVETLGGDGTVINTGLISGGLGVASFGAGADYFDSRLGALSGRVEMGAGNDTAYGSEGEDHIEGGVDNDLLRGMAGIDDLRGGTGRDTLEGGAGADILDGGEGNDTIFGNSGDDFITGGTQNDSIHGQRGNDTIVGDTGNDTVIGGAGHDNITGGQGSDELRGGDDNDTVVGNLGNDTLFGGAGADSLLAGDSNDTVYGNQDADTIDGGAGADVLFGGWGGDTFLFNSAVEIGGYGTGLPSDRIMDFEQGSDVIDLSPIDALTTTTADDAFTFLGTAPHSGSGATLRYINTSTDTILYGDIDADGAADFGLRLNGVFALTTGDFVL